MKNNYRKNNNGFIALSTVTITMFIILLVVTSLTLQSINDVSVTTSYLNYKQAKLDADSCFIDILGEIYNNPLFDYTGSKTLTTNNTEDITCTDVSVVSVDENISTVELKSGIEYLSFVTATIDKELDLEIVFYGTESF